jgi:amidophosphoribosyltransferase
MKNKEIYNLIHNHDERLKEECGVIGIHQPKGVDCSTLVYYGLYSLQHRGQESAGIAVSNGETLDYYKDMGLVPDIFNSRKLEKLEGNIGIGHVRYSTTGASLFENAQPLVVNYRGQRISLAHNGNLTNTAVLRRKMEDQGTIFQTTIDTEIIANLIAQNLNGSDIISAIKSSMKIIEGAYAVVVVSGDKLIGFRDEYGIRPLCIGQMPNGGFVLASESCALDTMGAELIRDVEPGEIIEIDESGLRAYKAENQKDKKLCVFELVYFSRPDSVIDGKSAQSYRFKSGKVLAKQTPVEADFVIGVPDSGIPAAIGFSEESGIPYGVGLIKNRYVGRTFIQPNQAMREQGVRIKLNVLKRNVEGKRVVIIDDSIVRGTTSRRIVTMLRQAGAKEVHFRVSSPPVISPCYYGIDTPTEGELLANSKTIDEIRDYLGADSLDYISVDGLSEAAGKNFFCKACFNKDYPVKVKK